MKKYIGIDLGTTFCAVAMLDDTGRPSIVHNSDGQNITASYLEWRDDGVVEAGQNARKTFGINPRVVGRFKSEMGTNKTYEIDGNSYTPTQLSSLLLKKLLQDTLSEIGLVAEAVVTIPANFSNDAREATMQAAKDAGLNVKFIINEPTAAALYYAYNSGGQLNGHYAVYDLGGGTFDISIIKVDSHEIDVIRSNGIKKLGGDDFDKALQKLVIQKTNEEFGEEINNEDYPISQAEDDKIKLSKRDKIEVQINSIRKFIEINRSDYEESISTLIVQTKMACEACINESGISIGDIESVFLVGGSTRMPIIKEIVEKFFNQKPLQTVNVDEVVALGASLYAAYKSDQSELNPVQRSEISKLTVGESSGQYYGTTALVEKEGGTRIIENAILINKGQKIPCSKTESFYTIADGQVKVNCDVTESGRKETDPEYVNTIWDGNLDLPSGRPKGQEIKVTFGYDDNQIMNCSFIDVATGDKKEIKLTLQSIKTDEDSDISEFLVE